MSGKTTGRLATLGPNPLLGSGEELQMSVVASAGEALHHPILTALDGGIRRLSG